jgi:predicted DsbA family dithiol-disulfide isomerase
MQAAKCAQLQGDNLFNPFHLLLFEALHLEKKDIASEEVLKEIAGKAHLDIPKFIEDLRSDASRQQVGQDHMEAVESYRVFGVPTLVINQKWPFFVKLGSLPDSAEEKVSMFKEVRELILNQPHVLEIKRT